MDIAMIISLIGAAVLLGGVLVRHEQRMSEIIAKLVVLESKVTPFWDFMQRNIGKLWGANENPDHALIAKLGDGTIDYREVDILEHQLVKEIAEQKVQQPINALFTLWILRSQKAEMDVSLDEKK